MNKNKTKADSEFFFRQYLNEARRNLLEAIRIHEKAEHNNGQPCFNERVNAIAWLSHSLLLTPVNIEQLRELLADYDKTHQEHNH